LSYQFNQYFALIYQVAVEAVIDQVNQLVKFVEIDFWDKLIAKECKNLLKQLLRFLVVAHPIIGLHC
jgi:hypothetical protein